MSHPNHSAFIDRTKTFSQLRESCTHYAQTLSANVKSMRLFSLFSIVCHDLLVGGAGAAAENLDRHYISDRQNGFRISIHKFTQGVPVWKMKLAVLH